VDSREAGHVVRTWGRETHIAFRWGTVKERQLGRPRRRWEANVHRMGANEVDCSCLRKGQVAGYCEHGNEPSGFVKCGEFLKFLEDYHVLLVKDCGCDDVRKPHPQVVTLFEVMIANGTLHQPFKPNVYYTCMYSQYSTKQFHVVPTHCIYVFCVDWRTNSHYLPVRH
jgi:hypothetical protein